MLTNVLNTRGTEKEQDLKYFLPTQRSQPTNCRTSLVAGILAPVVRVHERLLNIFNFQLTVTTVFLSTLKSAERSKFNYLILYFYISC